MEYELDEWQKEVVATDGNICLRSGRQVGKSFVISIKAAEYAIKHKSKSVMVIAAVERQAFLLFEKILGYLVDKYPNHIQKGANKPTKHKITLKNGSIIQCFPTGLSGYGIRGFTIDLLIADEAAFIPEEVWTAVTPMLAVTKGHIILLSTPHGRNGYYYDCFTNEDFTAFHVSSEDCPRGDMKFLAREKARMTDVQYAQEYLGEFIDELRQFFPDELIKRCIERTKIEAGDKYLGVDVARLGNDETVFCTMTRFMRDRLSMIDCEIGTKMRTTETSDRIIILDQANNYKQIYVDDGGVGGGVFDELLVSPQTKRKITAINNASRPFTYDEKRKKKILKEDLYNNIKALMERGKLSLLDLPEVFQSFKSVQYEYNVETKRFTLFGNYTHIVEAAIRAAWCMRDKSLNIWVA